MQINSATQSQATGQASASMTSSEGPKTLGVNDFLKLLSVQMQSQDPLNPMQDTQFISQMTSFTSLEQMKNLSASLETFIGQQRSVDAQTYLGKQVTLLDPAKGSISGTVTAVSFSDGQPQIVVNGQSYDPAMIMAIQQGASVPPTSSPSAN